MRGHSPTPMRGFLWTWYSAYFDRHQIFSDIQNVTKDVTYENDLTETERSVLAILKRNPESSRDEIATKISKTVRTVQRALVVLTDKGYIRRVGAKKKSTWEVIK